MNNEKPSDAPLEATTDEIAPPREVVATRFGMDLGELESTLGTALARRADFAELFFEHRSSHSVSLDEGMVKKANQQIVQGVGVRVLAGEKTGYAFSDEVSAEHLELAARNARAIAETSQESRTVALHAREGQPRNNLYPVETSDLLPALPDRAALLSRVDEAARGFDPRIRNVMASVVVEEKVVVIANSQGQLVTDHRPLLRLSVSCIAEQGNKRQQGTSGGGGRQAFSFLVDDQERALAFARDAARQAIVNLDAIDAPAGEMNVVLGPGWPGVLLHEAVGHGLEGDFNRKGTSAFAKLMGNRSPPNFALWSMMAPSPDAGARSISTTREPQPSATCSSKRENSAAICRIDSTPNSWAWRPREAGAAKASCMPPYRV